MNLTVHKKELVCSIDELPALPGIAVKILEKIREGEKSLFELAEILEADPTLSAKVLSIVNSPFFGLSNSITNLPHAVSLLGGESLKYIALSFSFLSLFKGDKTFDYSSFWRQSVTCAVISRLISRALERTDYEDIYFLGLIHNIGILALVQICPEQYDIVIKKVAENHVDTHIAENEVFGFNHMDVGTLLVEKWGLPRIFFLPILNHHYPDRISKKNEKELMTAKIIHLSLKITDFFHSGNKGLDLAMVNRLLSDYEMTGKIDLDIIVKEASDYLEPLLQLFNINNYDNLDYIRILEDGKKEMVRLSSEMALIIRQQQEMIENLSLQASHDGLTNLKNYKSFKEALKNELELCQRYGHTSVLALADIDNFKSLNDKLGHMAGDHVLKEISRFFTENMRKFDTVARYGGEEFAFILTRTSIEKGFSIMDRLRNNLAKLQVEYQNKKFSITMSVGITSFSEKNQYTGIELLRQADSAMYRAKRSGRNRTFMFDSGNG